MTSTKRKILEQKKVLSHSGHVFSEIPKLDENVEYSFFDNSWDVKSFKNKAQLVAAKKKISLVNQVHGVEVKHTEEAGADADGLIVREGESAGIMTADCTPVILYCSAVRIGAVLHCGWKSALDGIIYKTITKFYNLGFNLNNTVALIGPAAQLCCYEVSADFIQKVADAEMFSRVSENDDSPLKSVVMLEDKFYVSIPKLVERQLIAVGVQKSKIYRAKNCTICDGSFFSYRKDGESAGRQLTYLSIGSSK